MLAAQGGSKEDGEECRWGWGGYEGGEHVVFHCQKMWRPAANIGQKWRTWEDLDNKRWITKNFVSWAYHPEKWVCVIDKNKQKRQGLMSEK